MDFPDFYKCWDNVLNVQIHHSGLKPTKLMN